MSVTRHGPLRLVTFAGGRGFVTYRDLGEVDAPTIRRLVAEALAHYQADQQSTRVERKTRGHDRAPGLYEALQQHDFVPAEPATIMIAHAHALDVPRAMSALQDEVFGDPVSEDMAQALLRTCHLSRPAAHARPYRVATGSPSAGMHGDDLGWRLTRGAAEGG